MLGDKIINTKYSDTYLTDKLLMTTCSREVIEIQAMLTTEQNSHSCGSRALHVHAQKWQCTSTLPTRGTLNYHADDQYIMILMGA